MIKLSGTLAIRTITGIRGNFNVGRLVTEIGEFAVKDPLIEEYDEGRYEGEFGIAQISPSHYVTNGRLVVEVRARIVSIALANIDELNAADHSAMVEPDPVEEDLKSTSAPASPVVDAATTVAGERAAPVETGALPSPAGTTGTTTDAEPLVRNEEALRELFGELWPLSNRVKLDPTVDRSRFRGQRDALKTLGYEFQPIGQVWTQA